MSIFSYNDAMMKNCRNVLYELIKQARCSDEEKELRVVHKKALDDSLYMVIGNRGEETRINSCYSPDNEAGVWAQGCFEKYSIRRTIALYGFGNGYCVRQICKRLGREDSLIVYEPSVKIFTDVMKNYDITDIITNPKVYLYVGWNSFIDFKNVYMNKVGIINARWSHEISHPQYENILQKHYNEYYSYILGYKKSLLSDGAYLELWGRLVVNNILYSISSMKGNDTIYNLKGRMPKGRTAIVVSAGPSLKKNIDMLKGPHNKALVIGTDSAVNTMLCHNIIPDAIIGCDPDKKWKGDNDAVNDIPYICAFSTDKDMVKEHRGIRYHFSGSSSVATMFGMDGRQDCLEDAGGSVSTIAVLICEMLGFSNVILIGQDLAYGEDGKSHAGRDEEKSEDNHCEVEGINGEILRSREDWVAHLRHLEDYCMRHPNVNIIDSTEGGARISGTMVMTLKEAIEKYCNEEFDYRVALESRETSVSQADMDIIRAKVEDLKSFYIKIGENMRYMVVVLDQIMAGEHSLSLLERDDYKKILFKVSEYIDYDRMQLLLYYIMKDASNYFFNLYKEADNEEELVENHIECLRGICTAISEGVEGFCGLFDEYFGEGDR